MRAPLLADAERTREALSDVARSPGVAELRTTEGEPIDLAGVGAGSTGTPTDAEQLARELLGDASPLWQEAATPGVPWRFVLGMLASVGLLVVAGVLYWSSLPHGKG
jgi:hypothetical protein